MGGLVGLNRAAGDVKFKRLAPSASECPLTALQLLGLALLRLQSVPLGGQRELQLRTALLKRSHLLAGHGPQVAPCRCHGDRGEGAGTVRGLVKGAGGDGGLFHAASGGKRGRRESGSAET